MIFLIKLVLAHLIGDFVLQPTSWVTDKERRKVKSGFLYGHVLVHGGLILLLFWNFSIWPVALIITILHFLIDLLKAYGQKQPSSKWFLGDQFLHLISILGVYYWWFQPDWDWRSFFDNTQIWLFVTALVIITGVSSVVIRVLLRQWEKAIDDEEDNSLNRAGAWIGILERLFAFVFVITGNWAPLGFLLAAKSIFRFGNLQEAKDRKLTEYILIGTLLSFAIAVGVGLGFKFISEKVIFF